MRKTIASLPGAKSAYRQFDRTARRVRRLLRRGPPDKAIARAAKFISSRTNGFFVQIGSNDGVTGDPIHGHVMARDWSGVVVEPLPDLFERLEATYRGVPRVRAIRAAVSATSGITTIYRVEGHLADDPPWADQLASFDREVIMKHSHAVRNLSERVKPVDVPTITWDDLRAIVGPIVIDLLHVDTEGHDYEILRRIDWAALHAPTAVLYEHKHLSAIDSELSQRMFESAGYSVTVGAGDTFCERRPGNRTNK